MILTCKDMYAIVFDLDIEKLKTHYPNDSFKNAYAIIQKELENFGFKRQQDSTYFGDRNKVTVVDCVLAVQSLSKKHSWFKPSVKDIRMLKIVDNDDLSKVL